MTKDPRKQYTMGKIPKQKQPEPGLDAKLAPQAEHGEKEYVGKGRLKGRKALITGGDSGIGRAVAIAYAHEGADVAISYLPSEEVDAKKTARAMEKAGGKVILLPGDLIDEKFARKLPGDAHKKLGGLDIIVNNAAKQVFNDDITTVTTKQIVETFTVNIFAMF